MAQAPATGVATSGVTADTRDDGVVIPASTVTAITSLARAASPRCGDTRVLCVDGPAGSGKTTLAAALSAALDDAPVVHMDDLYAGWEQDLGAALASRVGAWLLDAWEAGLTGQHLRFDWHAGRYADWIAVPAAAVVIIEGCGSASRGIRERASLVVWVEAPEQVRLDRGRERDGAAMAAEWRRWAAREAAHFVADRTREASEVVVDGLTGGIVPADAPD